MPTPRRFLYARALLPPVCVYLLFFVLLAVYLALAGTPATPTAAGRMGWQENEAIQLYDAKVDAPAVNETLADEVNGGEQDDATSADSIDGALPLDVWDPLLPHRTGLTAIAVKACIFSPALFPDICAPDSTPEEDSQFGKWVRVGKDLNKVSGVWWNSLYYRRSRRFDVPYITAIVVVPKGDSLPTGFIQAAGDDLHSGSWPQLPAMSLAYKLRYPPGVANGSMPEVDAEENEKGEDEDAVDEKEVVTEIDVLYGDGEPWWGFLKVKPLVLEKTKKHEAVGLTVRMGVPDIPKAPELRMSSNGTFRIMQVADLHYSIGPGVCRDTPKTPCVGDVDTAALLAEVLDAEKPDLVVFSGDQLNGQDTSWDAMSVLAKFAKPVIDRKIPWTATFGNHDSQDGERKSEQLRAMMRLPYSLVSASPKSVDGDGNQLLKIYSHDASKTHLASVYVLDSGDYIKSHNPFAKPMYDYIKASQTDWYLSTSASIKPIERPFVPDGADDLDGIWPRAGPKRLGARQDTVEAERTLEKPPAIMFFHIPLQEHTDAPDLDPDTGVPLDIGLMYEEGGSSSINGGFFYEGIKQAFTGAYSSTGIALNEVKVIGNGHVHTSENCRRVSGVWHCFGGGGSYSGYGRKDLMRRFRIYDVLEHGARIATYKHTEGGEIVDRMDLYGGTAPGIV